jgi:uncharacterized membrane protein
MLKLIEFTYALQIVVIAGGIAAALLVNPLFLVFSVVNLVLMIVLYQTEQVYRQLSTGSQNY